MHLFLLILGTILGIWTLLNIASLTGIGRTPMPPYPGITFVITLALAAGSFTCFWYGV